MRRLAHSKRLCVWYMSPSPMTIRKSNILLPVLWWLSTAAKLYIILYICMVPEAWRDTFFLVFLFTAHLTLNLCGVAGKTEGGGATSPSKRHTPFQPFSILPPCHFRFSVLSFEIFQVFLFCYTLQKIQKSIYNFVLRYVMCTQLKST